ncbi:MAG: hypothetical protein UZ21_OP11001000667 [Microgenomates bacterium OLB22]|nr:MAG: hypothetical protein UZ21_OP11001000667 [Microgenomates bacterium OLB22]
MSALVRDMLNLYVNTRSSERRAELRDSLARELLLVFRGGTDYEAQEAILGFLDAFNTLEGRINQVEHLIRDLDRRTRKDVFIGG